jgi:MOSC domain-containing protein YiiM
VLGRGPNNEVVRKTGVMTIVLKGGVVVPGNRIAIQFPVPPLLPLEVV